MGTANQPSENHIKVLGGQGWIGLIDNLGSETSIVNAARVSFGKMKEKLNKKDIPLLEYLIENKHTSPFEHVVFSFIIHCPLFVRSQWHRHRTWSYNEISRRYTNFDIEFYTPQTLRQQSENNRQASFYNPQFNDEKLIKEIEDYHKRSFAFYEKLIDSGVSREQARGVLPQNMMVTFWGTVNLNNLIHFLELRDHEHAQWEIREYAVAIKKLIKPYIPNVANYFQW